MVGILFLKNIIDNIIATAKIGKIIQDCISGTGCNSGTGRVVVGVDFGGVESAIEND